MIYMIWYIYIYIDIRYKIYMSSYNVIARHWALSLHQSKLGNSLQYNNNFTNSWILDSPPFWFESRDHVEAIQLRVGFLPTGRASYILRSQTADTQLSLGGENIISHSLTMSSDALSAHLETRQSNLRSHGSLEENWNEYSWCIQD